VFDGRVFLENILQKFPINLIKRLKLLKLHFTFILELKPIPPQKPNSLNIPPVLVGKHVFNVEQVPFTERFFVICDLELTYDRVQGFGKG
jgi:hypothetical protein